VCTRVLERWKPEPSLPDDGDPATVWGLARAVETSFLMVVTVLLGAGGVFDEAFLEDRKKRVPGVDFSKAPLIVPAKRLQLRANLDLLERQLADGRRFLLGERPGMVDLAAQPPGGLVRGSCAEALHPAHCGEGSP
jgi:glutathione S-transferase